MVLCIGVLETFDSIFMYYFYRTMNKKIGIATRSDQRPLVDELLKIMERSKVDYTRTFRNLAKFQTIHTTSEEAPLQERFLVDILEVRDSEALVEWKKWLTRYNNVLLGQRSDDRKRAQAMNKHNPKYVLRNYMAQMAIEKAEQGDYSEIGLLLDLLSSPFDEQPKHVYYSQRPPGWSKTLHVSCSS